MHTKHCDSGDPLGALSFDYLMWIRYEPNTGRLIKATACIRSQAEPKTSHQVPGQDRAERRPERVAGAAERRRIGGIRCPARRVLARRLSAGAGVAAPLFIPEL